MKKILILCLLSISFSQQFDYSKMSETEKIMMYNSMKKSPVAAVFLEIIPTAGYAYTDKWKRGLAFKGGQAAIWIVSLNRMNACDYDDLSYNYYDCYDPWLWTAIISSSIVQIWAFIDVGLETKKYNKRLKRQIFRKEASNLGFNLYPLQDGAGITFTYSFN